MKAHAVVLAVVLGATLSFAALAQSKASTWPDRQVRVIAASSAGGGTDTSARLFANWMQTKYKQPFVVENRPGAGQMVATEAVAKSVPDGYTLLVAGSAFAYQPLLLKNVSFDLAKDIAPVAMIAGSGYAFIVSTSIPAKTLAEFIAYAKANPGKLNHGMPGVFDPEFEDIKDRLGIGSIVTVMYKGGPEVVTAVAAGEVQLMQGAVYQANQLIEAGKARILAYTGSQRHAAIPEIPTLIESGYAGLTAGFWTGVFAPSGLSAEITNRINLDAQEMNKAPQTLERYKAQGYDAPYATPEQMRAQMAALTRTAATVFKRLGVKPQ
jgi:tripartite-type tricarboxylate transporter receptor subunit TctC